MLEWRWRGWRWRGGAAGASARLLRVVELGARSRHALRVALVRHFLHGAMRRSCGVAGGLGKRLCGWPVSLPVSACREGAGAAGRKHACAPQCAALWRRLRPRLHHVLNILRRQLALHLHLGGVDLLVVHCARTREG